MPYEWVYGKWNPLLLNFVRMPGWATHKRAQHVYCTSRYSATIACCVVAVAMCRLHTHPKAGHVDHQYTIAGTFGPQPL